MASVPPLSTISAPKARPGTTLQWAFTLNGIPFDRFAVPEELRLGVDVETKTHKYITERGRPRLRTHTQGAFLLETGWKGTFTTAQALSKARQIQNLANAGKPVSLVYGPNKWNCIIKKFHYIVRWQYEVDYDIEVQLVDDKNGLNIAPESTGFDAETDLWLLGGTGGFTDLQGLDTALPATLVATQAATTTALNSAYPLRSQSYPTLFGLTQNLDQLNNEFAKYIVSRTSLQTGSALAQIATAKLSQSNYALLNTSIKKVVGLGATSSKIIANAPSLIAIATQFYPSANPVTTAQFLAQANKLTSLFVAPGTPLSLPPLLGTDAKY